MWIYQFIGSYFFQKVQACNNMHRDPNVGHCAPTVVYYLLSSDLSRRCRWFFLEIGWCDDMYHKRRCSRLATSSSRLLMGLLYSAGECRRLVSSVRKSICLPVTVTDDDADNSDDNAAVKRCAWLLPASAAETFAFCHCQTVIDHLSIIQRGNISTSTAYTRTNDI